MGLIIDQITKLFTYVLQIKAEKSTQFSCYDLEQMPTIFKEYIRNFNKDLKLINREPEELWNEIRHVGDKGKNRS